MNKILKCILIVLGICVLFAIVWFVWLLNALGAFDKVYSPDDLKANFREKK